MQNTTPFQIYNASAGSGKTFTIVKEYLKILLQSNDLFRFQHILAITFTNKAAGEMKERILNTLQNFAKNKGDDMLPIIANELATSEDEIIEKSSKILQNILNNYSAFNISTIDSFTHKIIKTFAFDLGLSATANVELDASMLLNEAVDLVISKIGEDKALTKLLINYSLQKIDSDKDWDISNDLKSFAQIILNENHFEHFKTIDNLSISAFTTLKNELTKVNTSIEAKFIALGKKGQEIINEIGLDKSCYSGGGDLPNHFNKLINFKYLKIEELKFEGRLNNTITDGKKLFATKCNLNEKESITQYTNALTSIYEESKQLYNQQFSTYILNQLIVESLIPLAVLNYINQSLQEIKNEKDVLLNAEFNKIISDSIKNEPAPFIYERLGEKFRYYFIDEMQDTSQLQWQNLIPLIDHAITSENTMGEIGKLVLVGDAKQSIYRWRGGKAEQFMQLTTKANNNLSNPFVVTKAINKLPYNFRSYAEVVNFNNNFFSYISKYFNNQLYNKLYEEGNAQKKHKKDGGYVQLKFVDKDNELDNPADVFSAAVYDAILEADQQFKRSEICILTRTKKQGVEVANYLAQKNISIISSETLLLANNEKVNFIINVLSAFENPNNKEIRVQLLYFIYKHIKSSENKHQFITKFIHLNTNEFFRNLKSYGIVFSTIEIEQLSLYDGVESIIRNFKLTQTSDAHIQFFLDVVLEFQQQYGSSIANFLAYWEMKKDKLSIVAPEAENAIRVMTIHKAKGLEFPVVIYPFDTSIYYNKNDKVWYNLNAAEVPKVLINNTKKLQFAGENTSEIYNEEQHKLLLDSFNVLYVALTRAVEQLYIITENKKLSKKENEIKHTSQLFISYLKEQQFWDENKNTYTFGNPVRLSLAKHNETNTEVLKSFISNPWKNSKINVTTKASKLWISDKKEAVDYGNLIHQMLAEIKTIDNVEEVIAKYVYSGYLVNDAVDGVKLLLNKLINNPKLNAYFQQNNVVITEKEFLNADGVIEIPDRLIIDENNIVIIDYKTGEQNPKHIQQILNYAKTMEEIGYNVQKKILVYISNNILVQEV